MRIRGWVMTSFHSVLHRYVAPFLAGVCMAAATVVGGIVPVIALVGTAGVLVFLSLPAGVRMIAGHSDAEI